MNTKIFCFHYKPNTPIIVSGKGYYNIWVGKNNSSEISQLTGDDSGINISAKNKYYSELTGIYWIYKNQKAEIYGNCHYRRFFTCYPEPLLYKIKRFLYFLGGLNNKRHGLIYTSSFKNWGRKIISANEIEDILQTYDAILPVKRKLNHTVKEHFKKYHSPKDLLIVEEVINELSPGYAAAFEKMMDQKRMYANNLFILKEKDFQRLNEWLFSLLFEVEKRIQPEKHIGYQERVLGFISERLITLWFFNEKLKIKELPLIYFKKLKKIS